MVDEFDRVSDVATRTRLADTIKLLSDRAAPILFIVVGVSENLEELLGRHPSIQRNIIGVPLPLLKDAEIRTLLETGRAGRRPGVPHRRPGTRSPPSRAACRYIAQLLALHAGYAVLGRDGREVARADLEAALEMAVAEADPRMARLYETLTEGGRDTAMAAFLRALAGGVAGRLRALRRGARGRRTACASPGGSRRPSCGGAWWRPARCGAAATAGRTSSPCPRRPSPTTC